MNVHRLKFEHSAYPGPNHRLEYYDGKLYALTGNYILSWSSDPLAMIYKLGPEDRKYIKVIKPTQDDWSEFYDGLQKISIEKWEKTYDDHDICDGLSWEFSVRIAHINKATSGHAQFPGSEVGVDDPFDKLIVMLSKLTGGVFKKVGY